MIAEREKQPKLICLNLPGGEFDVWRKQMGLWDFLKTSAVFLKEIYMNELRVLDRDFANLSGDKIFRRLFYEPLIPEELWIPRGVRTI